MSKVYYNKLVRDRIEETILSKGQSCDVRELTDDAEFEQELLKKIVEESRALAHTRSRDEFLEEYADLLVALDALTQLLEFSEADVSTAIAENAERKGLYQNRHFLHWSDDDGYESNETPQGLRKNG
jgi:predicted house-cleaning noncanonical NTP pyrophosphatase (MazG superfamily)